MSTLFELLPDPTVNEQDLVTIAEILANIMANTYGHEHVMGGSAIADQTTVVLCQEEMQAISDFICQHATPYTRRQLMHEMDEEDYVESFEIEDWK